MSSAQAQSLHAPETRAKLHGWFSRWGSSTEVEIEARVREVDPAKFEHLLRKLRSNPHWSVAPVTITSSDLLHASGVRETRGGPEGTSFLRKQKLETFDVFGTDSHHPVRLQASSEKPVGPCTTPLSMVRHKRRHTFVHKGLFKFELTEVKTGPSWETACHEDSEYEIEVEYCGQRAFEPKQTYLNYIIDAFVGKALDAALAYEPPAAGSGSLKRARTDGALSCGDTVVLSPGTCVALEPALGYRRSPNPAALTAAQSAQLEWIFSAVEPGADGSERAHLMSLPSVMDGESYALFHFSGHVPRAAIARGAPNFNL